MSVEFRYGDIASNFPVHLHHNTMIGISGDLNNSEYEQFYFHVRNGRPFGSAGDIGQRVFKYIQNTDGVNDGIVAKPHQELEPVSSLTYSPGVKPRDSTELRTLDPSK